MITSTKWSQKPKRMLLNKRTEETLLVDFHIKFKYSEDNFIIKLTDIMIQCRNYMAIEIEYFFIFKVYMIRV